MEDETLDPDLDYTDDCKSLSSDMPSQSLRGHFVKACHCEKTELPCQQHDLLGRGYVRLPLFELEAQALEFLELPVSWFQRYLVVR